MALNNTLETLSENYQQFSFQKDYGKYRANSGFLKLQNEEEAVEFEANEEKEEKEKNNRLPSVLQSGFTDEMGAKLDLNEKLTHNNGYNLVRKNTFKYNSSKFDNLQSILQNDTYQSGSGTVIQNQSLNSYGTTRIQPNNMDHEYEKENIPIWQKHIKLRKAQQQDDGLKGGFQSSISSTTSDSKSSSVSQRNNEITPVSSLNKSPTNNNRLYKKNEEPITHSTAVSMFNSNQGSSNFSSLQSGQQSPLKLFSSDQYNTYTQKRFENLISQYDEDERKKDESDSSIRILKNQNSNGNLKFSGKSSYQPSNKLASINEVPSNHTSVELSPSKPELKSHSRGNSKNIQGLNTTNTKQINDYLLFADNIFDKCLQNGPGVSSKESLHPESGTANSGPFIEDTASYTSDDGSFDKGNFSIRKGQGRLSHPENGGRGNLPRFNNIKSFESQGRYDDSQNVYDSQNHHDNQSSYDSQNHYDNQNPYDSQNHYDITYEETNTNTSIQNVTNNMSTFNTQGDLHHEEPEDNIYNETTAITHNFMDSFIEPKLKTKYQSGNPENYDYDINESFMDEISEGKENNIGKSSFKSNNQRVNFKKLLKFAPGEIEIPDKYNGMVFDKRLNKWVKHTRKSYDESVSSRSFNVTRDDENVNALNAIADLSVANSGTKYTGSSNTSANSTDPHVTTGNNTMMNNEITFDQLPNVSNISQIDTTFSASKKALVSILIDVIQKNRNWDMVKDITVANKGLSTLVEFNQMLPNLRVLKVDHNLLRNLDGLPDRIDNISARSNKLNGLLSLERYQDLEILDVSDNFFKTLSTFENLFHLRYLKISCNLINSISSLSKPSFQNLLSLDLSNNFIRGSVNLKRFKYLQNLQELDLSDNFINTLDGVKFLPKLIILKADNNPMKRFSYNVVDPNDTSYHKCLKKLTLKNNNLLEINLSHFKNLRVLRINDAIQFKHFSKLHKLDELLLNGDFESSTKKTNLNYVILKDAMEYNTITTLNITNTGISTLKIQQSLALETLYCLFNKISNFQVLMEDIKFFTNLRRLDLRFNPITIEFYLVGNKNHLLSCYYNHNIAKQDETSEDQDSDYSTLEEHPSALSPQDIFKGPLQRKWQLQDEQFVESLKSNNLSIYKKRIYYQGLILSIFRKLKYLDGLLISSEKRSQIMKEFDLHFKQQR